MTKTTILSFYNRLEDYPTKYSLSSMRLAAYMLAQPDLSDMELSILPLRLEDDPRSLAERIIDNGTDILGLPAYMWTSPKSLDLARMLKKKAPHILKVVGGPETSTFDYLGWPNDTLFVLGEGEKPLHWILSNLKSNSLEQSAKDMHPAVYTKSNGRNSSFNLLEETLAKGVPLYSDRFMKVLDQKEGIDTRFTWHDTAVSCPYTCGYCGHKTRQKVVLRDDDIVTEEIINIGKIGFENVFVIDPILGGLPGRDKKILRLYQKFAPDCAISAYYRPEYFNDETISILSDSYIKEILIGLQSTNPNVPNWLRSNNLEKVNRYLPQLSQKGIFNRIELITGMPGDTPDGQRESFRFVIDEIQPMSIWSYHLTLIPRTPLYGILNADSRGESLWIHADRNRSRATESSSYTSEDLDYMLIYAGAISSLYNYLKSRENVELSRKTVNLIQLEQIIMPVLVSADPQLIQYFRSSDMSNSISYWNKRLNQPG
jgi:radical SAM superfamily enzyme YgiQ (UPF0313 family)